MGCEALRDRAKHHKTTTDICVRGRENAIPGMLMLMEGIAGILVKSGAHDVMGELGSSRPGIESP